MVENKITKINKLKRFWNKLSILDILSLVLPTIITLLFVLMMWLTGWTKELYNDGRIGSDHGYQSWEMLFTYCTEIFSTITFQLRIYWTAKEKIQLAAIIGAISWGAAIFGVIVYADMDFIGMIATSVPIFAATYQGIYINYAFNKKGK